MNALVLGHQGFIGKNICGKYTFDRSVDLCDRQCMFDAFDELQVNNTEMLTLVNCSGKHGSVLEMQANHFEYLTKNFLIDMNCLSLCVGKGIRNAVLLSSITAFPEHNKDVFSEEDIFNGPVSRSVYGYAASKRSTLDLCRCFYLDHGTNVVPVVLGNCYGCHGKFSSSATIVHKLIYDIDMAMQNDTDIVLSGDGSDIRTFLFAGDLPRIFQGLLSENLNGCPVVVASDEQINIKDLANFIAVTMGFGGKIKFSGVGLAGHKRKVARSKKINIRDYDPTSLEEGIKTTINFYRKGSHGTHLL